MQISPAIAIAFSAIARASRSVLFASALAAASAYGPPDPIATIPSSGSMRSPLPGKQESRGLVEDDQHRFQAAQDAIRAPILGELHGGSFQVAAILFQLGLEAGEQRKGVGRRAGKAGQDAFVVQTTDLLRAVLDHCLAEGHLSVSGQHGAVAMSDRKDCCAVKHRFSDCIGLRIGVSRKRDVWPPAETYRRASYVQIVRFGPILITSQWQMSCSLTSRGGLP